MTKAIKAIETRYKGYRFRSRLEARWAVFFDELELQWEYEPQGFETPVGPYLPDFRVWTPQGHPTWYEIKPGNILNDEKFSSFSALIKTNAEGDYEVGDRNNLLSGDPFEHCARRNKHGDHPTVCPRCGVIDFPESNFDFRWTNGEARFGCFWCDMETPCGGGHPWELGMLSVICTPHKGWLLMAAEDAEIFTKFIVSAMSTARSARFEYGECGRQMQSQ